MWEIKDGPEGLLCDPDWTPMTVSDREKGRREKGMGRGLRAKTESTLPRTLGSGELSVLVGMGFGDWGCDGLTNA